MRLSDFYDAVEADPHIEGYSVHVGDGDELARFDTVTVKHLPTGTHTTMPAETIDKHGWPELRRVITGEQQPEPLWHVTRVVGYFSTTRNWNAAKLGELADRRKGNYFVPDDPKW